MIGEWLVSHPDYTLSPLTFKDLGKSGYTGEHIKEGGGFATPLAAVETKAITEADVVRVEAIDRPGDSTSLVCWTSLGCAACS